MTAGYIQTFTGRKFWLFDPRPEDVSIDDIAHHLAHMCRYNGACSHFYSVAEHSVHVSDLVDPAYALVGLLHDAAEAYAGDVVRPLKVELGAYMSVEKRIQEVIFEAFGLNPSLPARRAVKQVDDRMLIDEMGQLMQWVPPYLSHVEPLDVFLDCYTPERAEAMFYARFKELTT